MTSVLYCRYAHAFDSQVINKKQIFVFFIYFYLFLQKYNTGISFGIFKKEIQAWWVKILFFLPTHHSRTESWWPIRRDVCSDDVQAFLCRRVLNSFDLLGNWNWAKTFSNWFKKWIENNFKNDRPEFSNTSHFNLVRSFERRIEPNVCASDKSFFSVFTRFSVYFRFWSIHDKFSSGSWYIFGKGFY